MLLKKITPLIILLLGSIASKGQGCETLLMNGVFNVFNQSTGNYTSSEWHNYWCNGIVEKIDEGRSTGAVLNLGIGKISLGLGFDDAKEFQRIYQSSNCGVNAGIYTDLNVHQVIQKVASPEILSAYVKCKEIEKGGLSVNLNVRPDDRKVFVLDVKFTKPWGNRNGPKVNQISFVPNVISVMEGSLQVGIGLKTGVSYSLVCERSTDIPLTVVIGTEVGTFVSNLPAFLPPPTQEELVMAAMPRGTILGWYDPLRIPKGWVTCDGKNGSPDLSSRFPMGTIDNKELGKTGGTTQHDHTMNVPRTQEGGKDDGWRVHERGAPAATGLDHWHKINAKEHLPPYSTIMFIMKL